MGLFASRFGRVEPRRNAAAFVSTLLAELPRVNCWTAAEHAGYPSPDAFQHLLARAKWDHDGVRDDLRDYVVAHLGTDGSTLVLDETGDAKKGTMTVAAQRQYTGTAGRIENAQVAVYAVWATPRGHGFVDRELYVPESWTDDPERCQAAGLPDDLEFATKPELALGIVQRILACGVCPGFVAADEVYGNASGFRAGWRSSAWVTCWRCPARQRSTSGRPGSGPTSWPGPWPTTAGRSVPPGAAPRGCAVSVGLPAPGRTRPTTRRAALPADPPLD